MKAPAVVLTLLSLAAVAIVVLRVADDPSPGPVSATHARVPELTGDGSCAACHGGAGETMGQACVRCHEEIRMQLARDDGRGLHARLAGPLRARCGACHGEHHGESFRPLNERSFALASVPEPARFEHGRDAGIPWELEGVHASLPCVRCHGHADADVVPRGARRYLGRSQQCTSCHEDAHDGGFGQDCARCHGQVDAFAKATRFEHDARFPLAGAHAAVECLSCHPRETPHALAAALGADPKADVRPCATCHQSAHAPGSLVAEGVVAFAATDCVRCHDTTSFRVPRPSAHDHSSYAFPLAGRHARISCAGCHGSSSQPAAWKAPGPRTVAACGACHDSPHTAVVSGTPGERSCAPCHDAEDESFSWPAARMPASAHAETGFPLVAPHGDLPCSACHPGIEERGRAAFERSFGQRRPRASFRPPLADDCASCHGDPHGGQFAADRWGDASCLTCHVRERFLPSAFSADLHERTAFPLTGSHTAVPCASCHPSSEGRAPAAKPVPRRFTAPLECAACHEDVHRGAFDRQGLAAVVRGKTGCARCHDTGSFSDIDVEGFDHAKLTGHALVGAHRKAACTACHAKEKGGEAVDVIGGARGTRRKVSSECASCHADPHAGQFRPAGGGATDCATCHDAAKTFAETRFDHQKHSRFRLDADHARLPCDSCHRAVGAGASRVVRYKPLGTACADCHDWRRKR